MLEDVDWGNVVPFALCCGDMLMFGFWKFVASLIQICQTQDERKTEEWCQIRKESKKDDKPDSVQLKKFSAENNKDWPICLLTTNHHLHSWTRYTNARIR